MTPELLMAWVTIGATALFGWGARLAAARLPEAPHPMARGPFLYGVLPYCSGALLAVALAHGLLPEQRVATAVLLGALAVSVASDLRFGFVFDAVCFPCALVLLTCAWMNDSLRSAVAGGALCGAPIIGIFAVSLGRGIGLGDCKLAVCIGLAFGMSAGIVAIGAAFIVGGCHGALLLMTRKATRGQSLPFAPYLAIGSTCVLALRELGLQ